jgi:hypothetical protein
MDIRAALSGVRHPACAPKRLAMTWFVEQRIAWIKESVEIFGYVNREHVMKKFGVSTPQASVDIREVMRRWPDLMEYDTSLKRYVDTSGIRTVKEKK